MSYRSHSKTAWDNNRWDNSRLLIDRIGSPHKNACVRSSANLWCHWHWYRFDESYHGQCCFGESWKTFVRMRKTKELYWCNSNGAIFHITVRCDSWHRLRVRNHLSFYCLTSLFSLFNSILLEQEQIQLLENRYLHM